MGRKEPLSFFCVSKFFSIKPSTHRHKHNSIPTYTSNSNPAALPEQQRIPQKQHRRALELHKRQQQQRLRHERLGGGSGGNLKQVHPTATAAAAAAERAPTSSATKKGLSKSAQKIGHGRSVAKGTITRSTGTKQGSSSRAATMPPSNGTSAESSPKQGGVSFRRLRRGGGGGGGSPHVDAGAANAEYDERRTAASATNANGSSGNGSRKARGGGTPRTDASTPASAKYSEAKTPAGVRGRGDLRSPGVRKTPLAAGGGSTTVDVRDQAAVAAAAAAAAAQNQKNPVPDFITQTDKYGNATTPRSADAIAGARRQHPAGPEPHIHVTADGRAVDDAGRELHPHEEEGAARASAGGSGGIDVDPCDTLLESLRMMCCCLLPEDSSAAAASKAVRGATSAHTTPLSSPGGTATVTRDSPAYYDKNGERTQYSTRESQEQILYEDAATENQVKLLPAHHPDDHGKKCLVLDLDETLVHSSFRAVPGADFVIPVQIEDVVHFVYVMKRPGVDEFLVEMAKHYEVVVYTASLNKYADPLLDLLDPHKTIRTRLFRESCVYYEGNYVKDLSLLDRDLTQSIIIDNSPSSYIFHPENAIDCTSFIDDPKDRELDQIGAFLKGIRAIDDVRGVSNMWRDWPRLRGVDGVIYEEDEQDA